MAKENTQSSPKSESNTAAKHASGHHISMPPQPKKKRKGALKYLAALVIIIVIVAGIYYAVSNMQKQTTEQIINKLSNSTLPNPNVSNSSQSGSGTPSPAMVATEHAFITDLGKSLNVSALHVSYNVYVSPVLIQENNTTVSASTNQTIDSYQLGNYSNISFVRNISYRSPDTGALVARNISYLYNYVTNTNETNSTANTTVTCINQTNYVNGIVNSSGIQCAYGYQGYDYIQLSPFTPLNVGNIAYVSQEGNISYMGLGTMSGRSCNDFVVTNESVNDTSNYSVSNICLDAQYGIPVYYNETDFTNGTPIYHILTTRLISGNVSKSDFVIPNNYISQAVYADQNDSD